ncbi:MAG TPA: GDP-mannose 4,6-dehydratase [Chloroflexota bacterium]
MSPTSSRRVLITGIGGQDGGYLAEQLLAEGHEVWGMVRGPAGLARARALPWLARAHLVEGDLAEAASLRRVLEAAAPDELYNLAAQSIPGRSWDDPEASAEVNALGPLRLLDAIRSAGGRGVRFCQASSSEMFGSDAPNPQDEDTPLRPRSPYGAAKAYAHYLTGHYRSTCGLFACTAILYNHESPRRPESFVTRKITRAAARIKLGRQSSLALGSLAARRDWGYTPDYVRAMRLMLRQEQPDDYVIGTGQTHSIGELVELAFRHVGLEWQRYVELDPVLARHGNPAGLQANPARARERLGWEPSLSFEEMIALMVEADLEIEAARAAP